MLEEPRSIDCPYCGESFETTVDCTAGTQSYIEDCPVCCRPIELCATVGINGDLQGLRAHRDDD